MRQYVPVFFWLSAPSGFLFLVFLLILGTLPFDNSAWVFILFFYFFNFYNGFCMYFLFPFAFCCHSFIFIYCGIYFPYFWNTLRYSIFYFFFVSFFYIFIFFIASLIFTFLLFFLRVLVPLPLGAYICLCMLLLFFAFLCIFCRLRFSFCL